MGRQAEYPLWADALLTVLLDVYGDKHVNMRYLKRKTHLEQAQIKKALQHLRLSGIAVMERNGVYWLSEEPLQQLWYASKRAKDMVARAETSLGTVQKQADRHVDKRFLAPLRRRFAFIRDELDEMLPHISEEIAKSNHEAV